MVDKKLLDSLTTSDKEEFADTLDSLIRQTFEVEKEYKSLQLLIKNIIKFIAPMREKREALAKDMEHVLAILKNGGEIARSQAKKKMIEVKEKVGLI